MYEDRIARGAAVLDAYDPAWRERVDVRRVDVYSLEWCVAAQAVDVDHSLVWHQVLERLGAPTLSDGQERWAIDHGFDAELVGDRERSYATLNAEWVAYLTDASFVPTGDEDDEEVAP